MVFIAAALVWGAASGVFHGVGNKAAAAVCAPIWVSVSGTQTSPASLAEFASGANGNAAPANRLGGPRNSKMVTASGVAQDASGYVYVVSPHINALHVYPPGASGDIAPFATLTGSNVGFNNPQGLVIRNGKMYVVNGPFGSGLTGAPSVAVFTLPLPAGTDNIAPVAVIAGPATGLVSPFGLALDAAGNIFVGNVNDTVTEYAPPPPSSFASPDNAAPILTIATPAPTEGIAIKGTTLYVSNDNHTITEYSLPTGSPGLTIAGANTNLAGPLGIDVDSSGNLFVVNTGTTVNQILEFAPGANGNATPTAIIAGSATTLLSAQFVFIAPCNTVPPPTTTVPPTTTTTVASKVTISAISPTTLGQGANVAVTVTGSGFKPGAAVTVSSPGITIGTVTVTNPNSLSVPLSVGVNAPVGTSSLTVTNTDGGHATCTACLTINPGPTVTSISPSSVARGATNVTLRVTGTHFVSGAKVTFSGTGITSGTTTFVNSTSLQVTVTVSSTAATGTRDVAVTNPDRGGGRCTGCLRVT